MKRVRLTELSICFRDFNKKYVDLRVNLQLGSLVNTANIHSLFYTDKMCRLNVNIHPISDRNWFPAIDTTKMETTYRIGHDKINAMLAFINLDELLAINNETQRLHYLSSWIQSVLKSYFDYNKIDSSNLINGFKQVIENNFYTYASKKYLNKTKDVTVWLEERLESEEKKIQLKIQESIDNTFSVRLCLKIIFCFYVILFRTIWQLVHNIHASADFVVFS